MEEYKWVIFLKTTEKMEKCVKLKEVILDLGGNNVITRASLKTALRKENKPTD